MRLRLSNRVDLRGPEFLVEDSRDGMLELAVDDLDGTLGVAEGDLDGMLEIALGELADSVVAKD